MATNNQPNRTGNTGKKQRLTRSGKPWHDWEFNQKLNALQGLPYDQFCKELDKLCYEYSEPINFKKDVLPNLLFIIFALGVTAVIIFIPELFLFPIIIGAILVPWLGEALNNGGKV